MARILQADADFMQRACQLAQRGEGWVNPNPQVGCVIVRDGRIIGEGWHGCFGGLHAEREALADCARRGEDARGATVYVTLEPCSHTGKQPPCADALIEADVARVVVGSADPNPLVSGQGCERLRRAGITVDEGIHQEACDALNAPFFHLMRTGLPLIIAKLAETLDGKVATRTGLSRWITGDEARARVHADRARFAAVMVGVGTVLADDPSLTARPDATLSSAGKPHQPLRIVCDTHLRTPLDAQLVQTAREVPTCIVTAQGDGAAFARLQDAGCRMLTVPERAGHVDLSAAMQALGDAGIDSVIVEGGPQLLGAVFDAQLANRLQAYIALKIFGGTDAPSSVGGRGVEAPTDACTLTAMTLTPLGSDILLEGAIAYPS